MIKNIVIYNILQVITTIEYWMNCGSIDIVLVFS